MRQKLIIIATLAGLIGLLLGAWGGFMIGLKQGTLASITTFKECEAAGYTIQESSPRRCVIPGGQTFTEVLIEEGVSIEGRVACLPHKNMDEPHTLECAVGLVTDEGEYYALKIPEGDTEISASAGGDHRITIIGLLKKEESAIYESSGTITVTSYELK